MRIICTFFVILILGAGITLKSQTAYQVARGERPFIDLNSVQTDAIVPGIIRIKITPEAYLCLHGREFHASDGNPVITGIKEIDELNELFSITHFASAFTSLYSANSGSIDFAERHKAWGFHLWYELTMDMKTDVISVVRQFMALNMVEFAEPSYLKQLIGNEKASEFEIVKDNSVMTIGNDWIPNDPQFDAQWHYRNTGQHGGVPGADINLAAAWELEKGNPNVIVAIVDGGLQYDHPDLAPNMWPNLGFNFVNNSPVIIPHEHGTHVAGTVAAATNNLAGVAGIAGGSGSGDGVKLMSCQVFTYSGSGGFHVAPVYAADNGAAINQNSWGYSAMGVYEQIVLDAIDYFNLNGGGSAMDGGITIFSAGNSGMSGLQYPACYSGAFSVAATNNVDQKAYYSTYGSWVDVSAPGGETNQVSQRGVLSTLPGNSYGFFQGTSMAAPHCTGVAALVLSSGYGSLDAESLREVLLQSTDDHYAMNPGYYGMLGTGRLNALKALQFAGPFAPPRNLTANAGDEVVHLSWEIPDQDSLTVFGYLIFRDHIQITQQPVNDTSFTDPGVTNHIQYMYFVKAIYADGLSFRSNMIEVIPNSGYAGGSGTMQDPYLISTADQLYNIRYQPDSQYLQISFIDLGQSSWNGGEGWLPVGSQSKPFSGTYSGNGFKILNLLVNRPVHDHCGMFGYADGAVFEGIGLEMVNITGKQFTGGLCGFAISSNFNECYTEGNVNGDKYAGGLVGKMDQGCISNSYSAAQIQGNSHAGSLTGENNGSVNHCYAVGFNNCITFSGGLSGSQNAGATSNSYWNNETTAQIVSAGGNMRNTLQMIQQTTFSDWNFTDVWAINEGSTYPFLQWQGSPATFNHPPEFIPPSFLVSQVSSDTVCLNWQPPSGGTPEGYNMYRNGIKLNQNGLVAGTNFSDTNTLGFEPYHYHVRAVYTNNNESAPSNTAYAMVMGFSGGTGTLSDPFLISTAYQLHATRMFLNAHFRQISDIDLGCSPWNQGEGWLPIGEENNAFTGSYDGNGKSIYNLYINRPEGYFVGLFGMSKYATVKNLNIIDGEVHGYRFVGILGGNFQSNSYLEKIAVINSDVHIYQRYGGGLAGFVDDSKFFRCFSTGNIYRYDLFFWNNVGGLIGAASSYTTGTGSQIEESYSLTNIISQSHNSYGGLVGGLWTKGEIKNCYARGSVIGTNARAGGLAGEVMAGSTLKKITNCYSTGLVSAPGEDVSGFAGTASGSTLFAANFWDKQTSGQTGQDVAATGKTTAQMKLQSTYTSSGWDFENIWAIDTTMVINNGYPYLKWQQISTVSGDANCDGVVNVQDVNTVVCYYIGFNPHPFCFENADLNEDGIVNVLDLVDIIFIILGTR